MRKTFLGFGQPGDLAAALVLSTLLGGCSGSAITGQPAGDAGGRDATHGAGGKAVSNGGAGGHTSDPAEDGGGPGGAAGGAPGAGGATGSGGVSGAGGIIATGGRPGSGGRSGAGGSSGADAGVDASSSCPAQLPISGGSCQGSMSCSYGQTNCCGHSSSAWACTCSGGSFSCSQTVECNIICPGHDASVGIDSSLDTSTESERDTSPADGGGVGAACGGPSDAPCTGLTFCDWPDNRCGTGVHGSCAEIPRGVLCAISPAPVCGCDGQNYLGGCQATQAGVDVSTTASCPPPAGWFRCGWTYCQHNVHYCSAQVGGAVTNPGSYTCVALPAACNGAPSCNCIGASGLLCSTNAQGDVTVTQEVP